MSRTGRNSPDRIEFQRIRQQERDEQRALRMHAEAVALLKRVEGYEWSIATVVGRSGAAIRVRRLREDIRLIERMPEYVRAVSKRK